MIALRRMVLVAVFIGKWSDRATHLVILVGAFRYKKSLSRRRFILDQDEIWRDCSSSRPKIYIGCPSQSFDMTSILSRYAYAYITKVNVNCERVGSRALTVDVRGRLASGERTADPLVPDPLVH